MKRTHVKWSCIFGITAMLGLIIDSKCVSAAAAHAVEQCLTAVIPSLFPLFVIISYALPGLSAIRVPWLSAFCGIPDGSESIFIMGLLGGFPLGAQCVSQSGMSKETSERMLGFCNNCGPAFLFGIVGCFFQDKRVPLILMLIQTLAALSVAHLWHGTPEKSQAAEIANITISQAVQKAIRSMATVCAWILLGNVILAFAGRWVFPFLPPLVCVALSGIFELTNGCFLLPNIGSEALRFIFAAGFICFGGFCVLLQIHSIVAPQGLSMRACIAQKALQGILGMVFAAVYLYAGIFSLPIIFFVILAGKKAVEKTRLLLYNKCDKGGISNAVSQTN